MDYNIATARPINAMLDAETRKTSNIPVVRVTIGDHAMDVPFLDWTDIYSETQEGQTFRAVVAGDGSIVILRTALQDRKTIQVRRIVDPTVDANWSTTAAPWRRVATKPEARNGQIPPVLTAAVNPANDRSTPNAAGRNKRVQAYWLTHIPGHSLIQGAHSPDYGVTWSSSYTVYSAPRTHWIDDLGADMSTNSGHLNGRLFFAYRHRTKAECQFGMTTLVAHTPTQYPNTYTTPVLSPDTWRDTTRSVGSIGVVNGPNPDDPTELVSFILSTKALRLGGARQDLIHCLPVRGTDAAPVWITPERRAYLGQPIHKNEVRASGPFANDTPPHYAITFSSIRYRGLDDGTDYAVRKENVFAFSPQPTVITETRPWKAPFGTTGTTLLRRPHDNTWYLIGETWAAKAAAYTPRNHVATLTDTLLSLNLPMRENRPSSGEIVLDNSRTNYTPDNHPAVFRAGAQVLVETGYRAGSADLALPQSAWYVQEVDYVKNRRTGAHVVNIRIGDPPAFIDSLWQAG